MQRILWLTILMSLIIFNSVFAKTNIIWEKKYNQFNDGKGESIVETSDGGFVLSGTYCDNQTDEYKHFLIHTDSAGNILWNKEFWVYTHHWDCNVQLTFDGGYIVCGGGTDGRLIKFDESGNIIWNKSYGDEGYQFGRYGIQTSDSGYAYTGSYGSESQPNNKIWLVKTDSNGEVQWTKMYGEFDLVGVGTSVIQTADMGYLISAHTWFEGENNENFVLTRTDLEGNIIWSKKYGPEDYRCRPEHTITTKDNGYITVGKAQDSKTEVSFVHIVKTNSSGDTLWTRMFQRDAWSWGHSIQELSDGGYIVAARTAKKFIMKWGYKNPDEIDAWIFKLNQDGEIEWEQILGGPYNDEILFIHQNSDDSFVFTGSYGIAEYNSELWFVKLSAEGDLSADIKIAQPMEFHLMQNFPNPFNPTTTIRYSLNKSNNVLLKIHNIAGQHLETLVNGFQSAGEHEIIWQSNGLPSGIYFYTLRTGNFSQTKKLILQK